MAAAERAETRRGGPGRSGSRGAGRAARSGPVPPRASPGPAAQCRRLGPSASRAVAETPVSGATSRYRYVATDGRSVVAGDGASVGGGPWAHVGEMVDAARQLVPDGELIVAVHPSAHFLLGLPETKGDISEPGGEGLRLRFGADALSEATSVREVGDSGGMVVERAGRARTQVMFPAYSGEFAGAADAGELVEAIELFCSAIGFGYLYSAASTVHRLIEFTQPRGKRLGPPAVHPVLDPPYAPMGYSVPAAAWSRPLSAAERARGWVVVCDRNGSYLSAWGSCVVADGGWAHQAAPFPVPPGKEPSRPAGYWLMDTAELAAITPAEWPDPFRRHRPGGEAVWLTTPLLQLAADLAGDRPLTVLEAWTADRIRPLDEAASRLAKARTQLVADPRPAARLALAAIKAGYVAATAWFEFGARPPAPLARPDWRRTIHDRFVANTWRSLRKSAVAPFALTDVDAALFALDDPAVPPDGLPMGTDLRSWKAKGRPVPMAQAVAAFDAGGPGAVIELAEAGS